MMQTISNKLLVFLISFCSIISLSHAQTYFSGEITYTFTYKPKDKTNQIEDLIIDMPTDSVVYSVKNGHYKSSRYYNGECIEFYTYTQQNKKMYYTTADRDYFIFFFPHDQKYSAPVFSEKHNDEKEILDYTTYMVTSVVNGMELLQFYSSEIKVDPASFKGHAFGAWDKLLTENEGAIPLRTVTNYYDHYEIKTATKIKFKDFAETDFEVPEGQEIVSSRESLDVLAEAEEQDQETYYCYMAKIEEVADKMIQGKNYNYVLRMVIDEEGKPSHIKAINSDYLGFDKVAEKIVNECNFKFSPGKIDNQYQKAEIFLPLAL